MLEIRLRASLLAYQNTIALDGVVITLDVTYHVRTDDWWLSIYAEDGTPIVEGRRMVSTWPLLLGTVDDRLPRGVLVLLPIGTQQAVEGVRRDLPGAGELGDTWRLVYYDADDLAAFEEDTDLLEPRAIREVES
jgi:hypothetical protein